MLKYPLIFFCLIVSLYQVTGYLRGRNYLSGSRNRLVRYGGSHCACGRSDGQLAKPPQESRIEKGHVVNPPYKYPWMVAIFKDKELHCGATIIAENFLLTAAHCFANGKITKVLDHVNGLCIVDGRTTTCNLPANELRVSFVGEEHSFKFLHAIKGFVVHPQFDYVSGVNDLAIIELASPIKCGRYTRPICLSDRFPGLAQGYKLVTGGWGKELKDQKETNNTIQLETTMQVMSNKECVTWSKGKANFVCMIGVYNQGICQGDSGGPLINLDHGSAYIVAVASHHYDVKCDSRYPQFFVDVKSYIGWIRTIIKQF